MAGFVLLKSLKLVSRKNLNGRENLEISTNTLLQTLTMYFLICRHGMNRGKGGTKVVIISFVSLEIGIDSGIDGSCSCGDHWIW